MSAAGGGGQPSARRTIRTHSFCLDLRTDELLAEVKDTELLEEARERKLIDAAGQRIPPAPTLAELRRVEEDLREAFAARDGSAFEVALLRLAAVTRLPVPVIPRATAVATLPDRVPS